MGTLSFERDLLPGKSIEPKIRMLIAAKHKQEHEDEGGNKERKSQIHILYQS